EFKPVPPRPLCNTTQEPTATTPTPPPIPTTRNLLPPAGLRSSATASNVSKLGLATGPAWTSTRLSSRLGNGTGAGASTTAALTGSGFGAEAGTRAGAMATAVPEPLDFITTGGGGGAAWTGLGAVTTGSLCNASSFARRSFNNNAAIWSAMVFNTATCVMVKA